MNITNFEGSNIQNYANESLPFVWLWLNSFGLYLHYLFIFVTYAVTVVDVHNKYSQSF